MKNGTTTANDFAFDAIHSALQNASKTATRHYEDVLKLNKLMDADDAAGKPFNKVTAAMRKEAIAQMGHWEAQEREFTVILQSIEKRTSWSPTSK